MKVYVVLEMDNYSDYIFCGVYATRKQADQRIDEIVNEFNKDSDNLYVDEIEI